MQFAIFRLRWCFALCIMLPSTEAIAMNIEKLKQAIELAKLLDGSATEPAPQATQDVIVCTDKRAVVFGECDDVTARPIKLKNARMCLYWPKDIGGVFGLGEMGPNKETKISATLPGITLEGVTAIFSVTEVAAKLWRAAKVQGR
jgi:hypothetical protein